MKSIYSPWYPRESGASKAAPVDLMAGLPAYGFEVCVDDATEQPWVRVRLRPRTDGAETKSADEEARE